MAIATAIEWCWSVISDSSTYKEHQSFLFQMKNINDQISVAFKNNINMQENWMQYPLYECYKTNKLSDSFNKLRIDGLSNRLKEMRNAMMQSRFK
jgi:hypothetical protein